MKPVLFRCFRFVFGVLAVIKSLVFVEGELLHKGQKVAVVYAGRTYHEEVTASITCLFHELSYYVVVYIENGFNWSGMLIPFTEKRIYSSQSLYGHCVDEFVTINNYMRIIDQPAVLLFVTYPMMNYGLGNGKDTYSFELLSRMDRTDTKLVLVAHHAEHFWIQANELSKYFGVNETTFLFLAKHVRENADTLLLQHPHLPRYRTDYVFPVFHLDKVISTATLYQVNTTWHNNPHVVTYSLQGNFGGKHAHRKDLHGTAACLNALGAALKQPNATQVYPQSLVPQQNKHQHKHSMHPRLRAIPAKGADTGNNVTLSFLPTLRLDLVGHLETGALSAITPTHFDLRTSGDVTCLQFYTRLSKAKYLLTALGSDAYARTQATSTVPAAVITHVPLLTTAAFLQLYPCLRDQPTLRRLSGATECESIRYAYALSSTEYELARGEMAACHEAQWAEGLQRMKKITEETQSG